MKLIVQPEAGVEPVLSAITRAKKSIDILIFRLDRADVALALKRAVTRGVVVRALTAHTNGGGEKRLRRLEAQLLKGGVLVSRTADDLVRYHGKMMIIDGRILHVYGFNFTVPDIEASRSFGLVTTNQRLVCEASKLFAADFDRHPCTPAPRQLVVSPDNSRDRLAAFLRGARRQLLIYDPGLTDTEMLKIISGRIRAGVDVRILGKVEPEWDVAWERFPGARLHVRAVVRDGRHAFIGSQSLRKLELDKRREVGVIVSDDKVVRQIQTVFERDWAQTPTGKKEARKAEKKEERALAAAS
jgi:phosphatidylserine/phosphatidylglycerophosphate/cardiolipin synthase-like enzyme